MRIRHAAAIAFAALLLGGCFSDSASEGREGIGPTDPTSGNGAPQTPVAGVGTFKALFQPTFGVFPYPTDLYFSGSTDGTLNIPATPFIPNVASLNALDGYSTSASMTARFSRPINAATIGPQTVIVLEVDTANATKATTGVRRPLVYGTDYTARVSPMLDSGGSTLEIVPLKPLTPSSAAACFAIADPLARAQCVGTTPGVGYLVILTNGLRDTAGNAATPDNDYQRIKGALPSCASLTGTLNSICQLTGAHLQIAGAVGVPAASVVLTFSFTTQAARDTLAIVDATTAPLGIGVVPTGANLSALSPALPPVADVYAGTLTINYFSDTAAPLTSRWEGAPFTAVAGAPTTTHLTRFNPVPVVKSQLDIPLFVTVPNLASGRTKPTGGWPVVIFQHGLSGNRTQSAAIAATYAAQGFVVAAIDIPLHGITDAANPFFQAGSERTFDLDLVNNATGAPGPDGIVDPSGTHIINLTSPLTSRDSLRQAAADLIALSRSLPTLDLDGDTLPDIDATAIHYSGISLGGIVGTVFNGQLGANTKSAYLNVPGGTISQLLRDSQALGPRINAGLAASGIQPNTVLYDQFLRDVQTVIDSGDPINYIGNAVALRPVLLTQIVNDTVIPNSATQRLVVAASLTKASAAGLTPVGAGNGRWVHFLSGSHGSLLDPTASLTVTTEAQTHAASLAASGGAAFQIVNSPLLEP